MKVRKVVINSVMLIYLFFNDFDNLFSLSFVQCFRAHFLLIQDYAYASLIRGLIVSELLSCQSLLIPFFLDYGQRSLS